MIYIRYIINEVKFGFAAGGWNQGRRGAFLSARLPPRHVDKYTAEVGSSVVCVCVCVEGWTHYLWLWQRGTCLTVQSKHRSPIEGMCLCWHELIMDHWSLGSGVRIVGLPLTVGGCNYFSFCGVCMKEWRITVSHKVLANELTIYVSTKVKTHEYM